MNQSSWRAQRAEALRLDQETLRSLEARAGPGSNTEPFWLLERSRLQVGNDLAALGRAQEARDEWDAILHSLSGPMESYEPKLLVVLEAADRRLGRLADAEAIAQRLANLSRSPNGG
jgi:hypothetical protein